MTSALIVTVVLFAKANSNNFWLTAQRCVSGFATTKRHYSYDWGPHAAGLQESITDLNASGGAVPVSTDARARAAAKILRAKGQSSSAVPDLLSDSALHSRGAAYSRADKAFYPQHAYGDVVVLSNCSITSGTAVLTCAGAGFTTADVGKRIDVNRAGVSSCFPNKYYGSVGGAQNCNLVTAIASRQSATQVTLSANAGSTVSGAQAVYGSDDTSAVQECIDRAIAARSTCHIPRGNYALYSHVIGTFSTVTIEGDSRDDTTLWQLGSVSGDTSTTTDILDINPNSHNLIIRNLGFAGTNVYAETNTFGAGTSDAIFICQTNAPNSACTGKLGSTSDILIDNVRADHMWGMGVHQPGSTAANPVDRVTIRNSTFNWHSYDCVNPNIHSGLVVANNSMTHCGTAGFEGTADVDTLIIGNMFYANHGGDISIGGGNHPEHVAVVGNISTQTGTYVDAGIAGGGGFGIIINSDVQSCSIAANVINDAGQRGITGGPTSSTASCTISGNEVSNSGYADYFLTGTRMTVAGNTARYKGSPNSSGGTDPFGMEIYQLTYSTVTGNGSNGHTLGDVFFKGDCTGIHDNVVAMFNSDAVWTLDRSTRTCNAVVKRSAILTATLSPLAVSANTSAEQTFTVTGARLGDMCSVTMAMAQAGLVLGGCRVLANDTIAITFGNFTGSPINPMASQPYTFTVSQ